MTTTETYYVLKAKDCFGDVWPLGSRLDGIDGKRHATFADAKAAADRFASSKDYRRELRLANRWETGTIRGLSIEEIKVS